MPSVRITVNGMSRDTGAATLAALLRELDYPGDAVVATAVNQQFVRAVDRAAQVIADGDAVEIVTPRQGG